MKRVFTGAICIFLIFSFFIAGCVKEEADQQIGEQSNLNNAQADNTDNDVTLVLAAAASLEKLFVNSLIPMFEEKNTGVKIEGVYDASGKLQTQIEEGLGADVFISAALKQMDALVEKGFVDNSASINLLENKLVLIAPVNSGTDITSFADINKADMIAIGDPQSVPAGQYTQEALIYLGVWDDITDKISLGTNVTQVLNWVAEGSAQVGFVYETDAKSTDRVKILATAPEGSLKNKIIYPAAILSNAKQKEKAQLFMDFLQSKEVGDIFVSYGFTPYN